MVKTATNLGRSGLQDWLIQRITAVFLAGYFLVLLGFWLSHRVMAYEQWHAFFENPVMKIFSGLALFSLVAHAWIGVWTIITDYIKPLSVRLGVQIVILISLVFDMGWGIRILWGVFT